MSARVQVGASTRTAPGVASGHRGAAVAVIGAVGAVGSLALASSARRALRRWEGSTLASEEIARPAESREIRVRTADDGELAVHLTERHGSGASSSLFVLAHGWTNDSRVWGPVTRRLVAAGHTVATYDHRGHGCSRPGSAGFGLDVLANDMWAVLEHLDARGAVLAGHSMGGMTVQALATMRPERFRERVSSAVLVATACDQIAVNRLAAKVAPQVVSHPRLEHALRSPTLGPFLVRRSVGKDACRTHLDTVCEMFVATSPRARSGLLQAMVAMDLSRALPDLDLPVTVVAGERDNLIPRAASRKIASLVAGARFVEITGAGHMLPIEAPQTLADILLDAARLVRQARPSRENYRPSREIYRPSRLGLDRRERQR